MTLVKRAKLRLRQQLEMRSHRVLAVGERILLKLAGDTEASYRPRMKQVTTKCRVGEKQDRGGVESKLSSSNSVRCLSALVSLEVQQHFVSHPVRTCMYM